MNNDFKQIASRCKQFRQSLGITQSSIAKDLKMGVANISAFENGKNNNAVIYNWYIERGLLEFIDYMERRNV